MSSRERLKEKMIKESVTLLPCFYFVEVRDRVYIRSFHLTGDNLQSE